MTESKSQSNDEEVQAFVIEQQTKEVLENLESVHAPISGFVAREDRKLLKNVLESVTNAIETGEGNPLSIIYDEVGKSFYERGVRDAVDMLLKGRGIGKTKIREILYEPYKKD